MAHPLAEASQGYDGRDQVGFFNHTGGCKSVGCEASEEFKFLSKSAIKIFDRAVDGMSWYEYSRHATSVLVYYLRSYDCILQRLDERELLDAVTWEQLVQFSNALYEEWPLRQRDWSVRHPLSENLHNHLINDPDCMNSLEILSTDIPLVERMMYLALDTQFLKDHFAAQLQQARDHVEKCIKALDSE